MITSIGEIDFYNKKMTANSLEININIKEMITYIREIGFYIKEISSTSLEI